MVIQNEEEDLGSTQIMEDLIWQAMEFWFYLVGNGIPLKGSLESGMIIIMC